MYQKSLCNITKTCTHYGPINWILANIDNVLLLYNIRYLMCILDTIRIESCAMSKDYWKPKGSSLQTKRDFQLYASGNVSKLLSRGIQRYIGVVVSRCEARLHNCIKILQVHNNYLSILQITAYYFKSRRKAGRKQNTAGYCSIPR